MFYFDKQNPLVLYSDIRREEHVLCDGRVFRISPDTVADFRALPHADEKFHSSSLIRHILKDVVHARGKGKNTENSQGRHGTPI